MIGNYNRHFNHRYALCENPLKQNKFVFSNWGKKKNPRQGLCPCTPPGALRRAPGPHPKSARAYALAMCAPRTCLPPKKKIGSRLRARYVRSAQEKKKKILQSGQGQ